MSELVANQIVVEIAREFIKKHNINKMEFDTIYDLEKEGHPINRALNTDKQVMLKYTTENFDRGNKENGYIMTGSSVEVRQRWGNQRVDIYHGNAFASIELNEKCEFSESQIFKDDGIKLHWELYVMLRRIKRQRGL